jgi:hypothetical protein
MGRSTLLSSPRCSEDMALIGAALVAAATGARPLLSSAARRAAAPLSCAAYSAAAGGIEHSPLPQRSFLARFRERRALAVTDITATVTSSPRVCALSHFSISWAGQIRCARIPWF